MNADDFYNKFGIIRNATLILFNNDLSGMIVSNRHTYNYFIKPVDQQTNLNIQTMNEELSETEINNVTERYKIVDDQWESVKPIFDGKIINGFKIKFVKVTYNAIEYAELSRMFNVGGCPTIKLITDDAIKQLYDIANPNYNLNETELEQFLNSSL